ncbi:MAG: thioesterase family protein [Carbonactinosporaceae bacterium]
MPAERHPEPSEAPPGEPFYEPLGEWDYRATPHTQGPWNSGHQHGGPPAALLAHALDRTAPRPAARIVRVALDYLRPLPVGEVTVTTQVLRDGRNTQLLGAELLAGGRACLRATAWRLRTTRLPVAREAPCVPPPIPAAGNGLAKADFGYARALDFRFVEGDFFVPGPAVVWTRVDRPLVGTAPMSPLERVLVAVDAASGVSAELAWEDYLFINVDLTVHLHRTPETAWVCMDARSHIDAAGVGLARTTLLDERGAVGAAAQALFVAPR